MAANQAIEYAPQCGDLTVESLVFQTNNVVGNFNYPQNVSAYKPICKFLMNCPLKKSITKCPLVLYRNFLREFWCTTNAYDPNPPADETQSRPLKEYLVKFSVMNGKKPLTLDFRTFTTSTGLKYNNGEYVAHPSPEAVKAELAKIVTNPSYLDKIPDLKNSFPVVWRILFTFMIQVLGKNYLSTEQINSIQQMIAYCLITGTKVDNGEIIYSDLVTKLTRSLSKKRQKPKSKKTLTETQVTPPTGPTEGSKQSYSVSSGNVPDPQDPKRNIQLAGTGLPSTSLDEGIRKSQPFPESTTTDPKDSRGNFQPANKGLPSTASDEGTVKTTSFPKGPRGDKDSEGLKPPTEPLTNLVVDLSGTGAKYQVDKTQSTRLRYRSLAKNKDKTSSEVEPGTEILQLTTFADVQALLLSDDEMVQESDEDDVLEAREEMDEDIPPIDEEAQSPPQTKNILNHLMHKNKVVASYADLRASVEDYYDENVDHKDQTNKLVKETMKILDNISKVGMDERAKLLKALNRVSETLEADSALKEEMKKMAKSYNTTFGNLLGLTKLINNAKLPELLTKLEGF
ncbi:hypothetical protein Tco_0431478 [Tanacetum coccineum]